MWRAEWGRSNRRISCSGATSTSCSDTSTSPCCSTESSYARTRTQMRTPKYPDQSSAVARRRFALLLVTPERSRLTAARVCGRFDLRLYVLVTSVCPAPPAPPAAHSHLGSKIRRLTTIRKTGKMASHCPCNAQISRSRMPPSAFATPFENLSPPPFAERARRRRRSTRYAATCTARGSHASAPESMLRPTSRTSTR